MRFENTSTCQTARYRELVDQFDATARAHLSACPPIAELCQISGLNHRTLLRAFRAIRATTPYRYLHALRLYEVRRTLLSNQSATQTVTQAALRFGFRELGRFAADYRTEFGESPSQTLRRASAISLAVRTEREPRPVKDASAS
jgi:AraC family ethanolamine operon transcriptional activator